MLPGVVAKNADAYRERFTEKVIWKRLWPLESEPWLPDVPTEGVWTTDKPGTILTDGLAKVVIRENKFEAYDYAVSEHFTERPSFQERKTFWTDGSCPGRNPALIHSAAAVAERLCGERWNTQFRMSEVVLAERLEPLHVEILAIHKAIKDFVDIAEGDWVSHGKLPWASLVIFSDSKDALKSLSKWQGPSSAGQDVAWAIDADMCVRWLEYIKDLYRIEDVQLHWVPGHFLVPGNKEADAYAVEVARDADTKAGVERGWVEYDSPSNPDESST